jgi:acyl-CoA thioesterase FadM
MAYFRNEITVDVHDIDFNGVARASSVMRYIQSAAELQLKSGGMSYDTLKEQKRAFILSKIKIEICESIHEGDKLTVETFPCESRGFSFLRCYGLERDGVTVGRAASIWALVDTESRALVPVNQFELGLDLIEPIDMSLDRIVMPKSETEVGSYTVNYADTDQNRHMNNTHYPDMYANFLPLDGLRIRSMSIQYMNEAPIGERLTVHRALEDGIYYFKTVRSDGKVNTLATVELERI